MNMANTCFRRGILSRTQRLGIITLICKDPEKAYDLKYWRPISLLCLDYKIISKCLTNRFKKVMGNLIHIDHLTLSSSVLHAIFNKDNIFLEMSIVMSMWANPYLEVEDV